MLGLEWIALHEPDAAMVLKIDTDALVIGPFADKAAAFLRANPAVGLLGLHDRHCSGESRSFVPWNRAIMNHALPVGIRRTTSNGRRLRWQLFNAFGAQRRVISLARANGYLWGEHCLGGAYLVRGQTVADLHARGLLRHACFWRDSLIGEDVIVGLYVKAAGWTMRGFVAAHEVFGIAYVGLPFPPTELESMGYSIIHSVKNDPRESEEDIRRHFRARRVPSGPIPATARA